MFQSIQVPSSLRQKKKKPRSQKENPKPSEKAILVQQTTFLRISPGNWRYLLHIACETLGHGKASFDP